MSWSLKFCSRVTWFRRLISSLRSKWSNAWRSVALSSSSFQGFVISRKISPRLIASTATFISV